MNAVRQRLWRFGRAAEALINAASSECIVRIVSCE